MVRVYSSIPEEHADQIKRMGIPTYQFIQSAVHDKLEELRFEASLKNQLFESEKRQKIEMKKLREEFQSDLLEATSVMRDIVADQVTKDAELKEKFNVAMQTILQKLS